MYGDQRIDISMTKCVITIMVIWLWFECNTAVSIRNLILIKSAVYKICYLTILRDNMCSGVESCGCFESESSSTSAEPKIHTLKIVKTWLLISYSRLHFTHTWLLRQELHSFLSVKALLEQLRLLGVLPIVEIPMYLSQWFL